ncbi:glycosyl hydrolase family 95 catalytic domain-containing protein [Streptomyces sp. NRRL WC-3742]|uniref:glycoside hydrolase family 95 protein n=1 Tax=Streptomyces sp. NRRL WC-3742 TaxID=1463934 RepID=UPI00099C8528|nr:glycoside hydrolase family 95 protein [Streptomyces sp. NRRL WC-3742]
MSVLRYRRPARAWTEALPIGNGYQGAMLFGGVETERLQINEGTAWSGSTASEQLPPTVTAEQARAAVEAARASLLAGDPEAAGTAVRELQHRHSQAFLPFVDLSLRVTPAGSGTWRSEPDLYERSLDLGTATHETRWRRDGTEVRQTSFAGHPDHVLVHRLRAGRPVDVELSLTSPLRTPGAVRSPGGAALAILLQLPSDVRPAHDQVQQPISWDGTPGAALRGAATVALLHDGEVVVGEDGTHATLTNVTTLDLVIATATTFEGMGRPPHGDEHDALVRASAQLTEALERGVPAIRERQLADHRELFGRVSWEMDAREPADGSTGERLLAANAHPRGALAADPRLAVLLFDYGRYLLISCSRRGGTPANLQGIWNDSMRAAWSSGFTTNINLQMNYWPAEVANLPETVPPLIELVEALSRNGRGTARRLYGASGWVAHHNTDIWAYTQPVGEGGHDPKWAFWPFAGPWLVRHLHDHLAYGARSEPDPEEFARRTVWPVTASAAEFLLDWLVEQSDGSLGTAPSTSPENEFLAPGGGAAAVTRSSAMDLGLAAELLQSLLDLAARLGRADDRLVDRARSALARIPAVRVGRDGGIAEWLDDHVAVDPRHRHQSHLYQLFPGAGLDEELRAAASRTLDLRGDDSTGWSLAWRLALRARLGEPEAVSRLLALLFRDMETDRGPWSGGLYPNLFAAHPPFQIDANLGYVAAVAECFVQSHDGRITLLPAVPAEFADGTVRGLVARPGVRVDLEWKQGETGAELVSARLRALHEGACGEHAIAYRGRQLTVRLDRRVTELGGDSLDP